MFDVSELRWPHEAQCCNPKPSLFLPTCMSRCIVAEPRRRMKIISEFSESLIVFHCASYVTEGRGRGGGRTGASTLNHASTIGDPSMGLMCSPFPQPANVGATMAGYNAFQYAAGMHSPAIQRVGSMHSPFTVDASYIFNPHLMYASTFGHDGVADAHTPSPSVGFKVPATPTGSKSRIRELNPEIVDLEVSQNLSHNAKRAHNRRLHAEFDEQVRTIQEPGGASVIRLRTNSRGVVCELRTKWHAAIKSLCHKDLRYSIRKFEKQDKRLVNCIIDAITNKMFRYEPYPLAEGAVLQFMQSHMNTARSRYRSYWLMEGCNDNKPHPSMSPGDWVDCAKFWKSEEGHQLSKRMSHVHSYVGRPKECGQEAKFWGEQNMVCCSH